MSVDAKTDPALVGTIARHLAEWEPAPPHVELAIFGSADAAAIAATLDHFLRNALGAPIDTVLFYASSIAMVTGLELSNGRRIVLRAHQPDWSHARLAEIVQLQTQVAASLALAPAVIDGPVPFARGLAVLEEYVDRGSVADPRDERIRRVLVSTLHEIVEALAPFVATSKLPPAFTPAAGDLWPAPHSRLFDFAATREGAEYIDRVAAEARARMHPAGRTVLGHCDFRIEHVRFEGGSPVAVFDWDSLHKLAEPALVGITAHAFIADWSGVDPAQAPSVEEARAFVADYEAARGRLFDANELRLCGAAFAYSVAYTARCGHALGHDHRDQAGTFQHLIATEGERLMLF